MGSAKAAWHFLKCFGGDVLDYALWLSPCSLISKIMPNQAIVSRTPFETDTTRNRCVLSCGHTILLSVDFQQALVQCPLCRIALLRSDDLASRPWPKEPAALEEQVEHLLRVGRRHWNGVNACEEAITKLLGPSDWVMEWFWHDKSATELIEKVKSENAIATQD